jgi:hypothetical protein
MVKMITKNDNQEYYEMSHALMNLEVYSKFNYRKMIKSPSKDRMEI